MAIALVDRIVEHLANGHEVKLPVLGRMFTRIYPAGYRGTSKKARRRVRFAATRRMAELAQRTFEDQCAALGKSPDEWPEIGEDEWRQHRQSSRPSTTT